MEKLKKVDRVIAVLLGSVSLFFIVVLFVDLQSAYQDPHTYEMVHHKSVAEYVRGSDGMITAFVVSLLISLMTLIDRKRVRIWKVALYFSVFLFVSVIIYSYMSWPATGFDH